MHSLLPILGLYLSFGWAFTMFEMPQILARTDEALRKIADEALPMLAGHPVEKVEKMLRRIYWGTIAMNMFLTSIKWLPILINRLRHAKGGSHE